MSLIKEKFNTAMPLPSILLQSWKDEMQDCDTVIFDSLDHFIYTVSKIKLKYDKACGVSYEEALKQLIQKESNFSKEQQKTIRNTVRSNLFKRGLITHEVYENFRYSTDGTQVSVDVGKYAAGEPDCVITPAKEYIDFFYELYVNVSYPHWVTDKEVKENVAKLLATVEELERQHIYIKINTVFCSLGSKKVQDYENPSKFFSIIPIFSHKDFKSVDLMSSVINDRLLRKFYFAILENLYGNEITSSYGQAKTLNKTINIGDSFDEIELFENIVKSTGA